MQIGPVTVLLEFLDIKKRLMLNLLCKRFYCVVMPAVSGRFVLNTSKQFPEWHEWGNGIATYEVKVQRGLSIRIGSDQGKYFGEWKVNGSETTVCGRGVLDC